MARALDYAVAIHGGAGAIDRDQPADTRAGYEHALRAALTIGRDMLAGGAAALDAVEASVRALEDDEHFNAGRGAVFTRDGRNELDAAIIDGSTGQCGAVGAVRHVRNPVSLARQVMEHTPHVLLVGEGAEALAADLGVELVSPDYFYSKRRHEQLLRARATGGVQKDHDVRVEGSRGTVGCVALDRTGRLAAATSTGGMTNKLPGRVGDTPLIGAGTFADARVAVSCTGIGEQFIRHVAAFHVAALVRYAGRQVDDAADYVVRHVLSAGDGGLITVDAAGQIAMPFNTPGMYRGAADASGRFDVAIW